MHKDAIADFYHFYKICCFRPLFLAFFRMSGSSILRFLITCGKIKRTVRTGWTRYGIEHPESVAEHMYRMALISTLLPKTEGFSVDKVMKMAIIHDLAECIVGDLTPYCGVSVEEKHAQEEAAMQSICEPLPADIRVELVDLLKEYDAQLTPEAIVCKDLDKFEMILQAFEYETQAEHPGWLEEFFQSTENVFKTPCVKEWVTALREARSKSTQ
uniref:5'-deoxynucleotidase HDDC2 n=2 Tax=Schistocephalus solidus TaxID=70667 RepID=A0A0X3Q289_SCHSO